MSKPTMSPVCEGWGTHGMYTIPEIRGEVLFTHEYTLLGEVKMGRVFAVEPVPKRDPRFRNDAP